ncbi:MAG: SMP-30/gluconolactonase/LRE family protein, partial [Gammaproteobacteria bacterium]
MRHSTLSSWVLLATLCGSVIADPIPSGSPLAEINLGERAGAEQVQAIWRYHDVAVVSATFNRADEKGQPYGAEAAAYDYTPRAGTLGFDDSSWEMVAPEDLAVRRTSGRLAFNWYRTTLTLPAAVNGVEMSGASLVLETMVDDYAEIWVDGELARAPGQRGGSVIAGWNAPNRVLLTRSAKPGQRIELAIFGINGPISAPPTNFIYLHHVRLQFYRGLPSPAAITPSEVNVEVERLDPEIDAVVPRNPKIFKLAEGFQFTEGPVWLPEGVLLFSDPNANTIYRYSPGDGALQVFKSKSGYSGTDIAEYGQPGSNGLALDGQGRLTINEHGNHRVSRIEADGAVTVLADAYEGRRLNSPNDL